MVSLKSPVHSILWIYDTCVSTKTNLLLIFSNDEVNEALDMWMNYFLSFNITYIIQYKEKCDSNINEEGINIPVISPSRFINKIRETRCYLNSTVQVRYRNIIFRDMVLNIDCGYIYSTTLIGMTKLLY